MQCRLNVVTINDTPIVFTNEPTPQINDIVINIKDSGSVNYERILTLSLKGVTSYLMVHNPTREKWESQTYPRLELASEHIDWYPAITRYTE